MLTIVDMLNDDIQVVSSLYVEVFNNNLPIPENWTTETAAARIKKTFESGFSFIAKDNDSIIGALIGYKSIFDTGEIYDIDTLIVRKDYSHKGIGKKLFEEAIQVAKAHKITNIHLLAHAQLESFQWYKKLGFKESGWVELVKTLV